MKILTILGTRPEIIRLSETIKLIDKNYNNILVHTGQNFNYELDKIFFKNSMKLVSQDKTELTDKINMYNLSKFNYLINEEMIKGEKILINSKCF